MIPLLRLAWRESRTARRRLLLYMSSISLGVAALVAIDSFSENVIQSVHEQSRALLGQVHAISPGFPVYGKITTNPAPAWQSLHAGHSIVVDPSLLVSLDAHVGDSLVLGNARFEI